MKLKSFRIKHFKSIKDSEPCYLSNDRITILAGKNESGKTSVLEALKEFSVYYEEIPDVFRPLDESGEPIIELIFSLDDETKPLILKTFESLNNEILNDFFNQTDEIKVTKVKAGDYLFDETLISILKTAINYDNISNSNQDIINNINDLFATLVGKKVIGKYTPLRSNYSYKKNKGIVEGNLPKISKLTSYSPLPDYMDIHEKLTDFSKPTKKEILNEIDTLSKNLTFDNPNEELLEHFIKYIPRFIFIKELSDYKGFNSEVNSMIGRNIIYDLSLIAGLDSNKIKNDAHLENVSQQLSRNFNQFWKQDEIKLKIEYKEDKLVISVIEEGKHNTYRFEQRSEGLQAFLSAFFNLIPKKGKNIILLIDEPGNKLHPIAQSDIMGLLEFVSEGNDVIFTTHSPYFINADKLWRVKTVTKDKTKGSVIHNSYWNGPKHKKQSDTLTPIITAIGLDLTKEFSIVKENNCVCEGQSDYFYLKAFQLILKDKVDEDIHIHFIPAVGANQIENIAPLLIAWELNYVILLDSDRKGIDVRKRLINNLAIDESMIMQIKEGQKSAIEDLFSQKDFCENVLCENYALFDMSIDNSIHAKKNNNVLLAKLLCEKIHKNMATFNWSDETLNNFENVLVSITSRLKSLNC